MPMRRYRRRRLGKSVLKRGLNHMTVPRAFPTTTLDGSFTGQQTIDLTGAVKTGASLFQLFAFRNNPDLTDSSHWANNSATGAGVSFPAQLYRNISMWAGFYDHCQILGMSISLNFVKFTAEPAMFRAYIWSSCDMDTSVVRSVDDSTHPVDVVLTSGTAAAFDDFKVLANTDSTVAHLELSRRVMKVDSRASKAVGRVDLDASFYLPFTHTRDGERIPREDYRTFGVPMHGNHESLTTQIAGVTSARYGFRNQINVAIISTSADNTTALSAQFFNNLTVKTKIHVKFLDRIGLVPA